MIIIIEAIIVLLHFFTIVNYRSCGADLLILDYCQRAFMIDYFICAVDATDLGKASYFKLAIMAKIFVKTISFKAIIIKIIAIINIIINAFIKEEETKNVFII